MFHKLKYQFQEKQKLNLFIWVFLLHTLSGSVLHTLGLDFKCQRNFISVSAIRPHKPSAANAGNNTHHMGGHLSVLADVLHGGQALWYGLASLLSLRRQQCGLVLQLTAD